MSSSYQDRPIVDGREQRYRYHLRKVDDVKRTYRFIHDLRTYSEACLYADVGLAMMRGTMHFVVWDSVERKILYDSRLLPAQSKTPG